MMLDTEELMPVGSTEGYRKNLTEMHAGGRGVEKLDTWQMQRFPNLEVLWLNDNKISKLQGLEYNFRLKHLYLQNNSITGAGLPARVWVPLRVKRAHLWAPKVAKRWFAICPPVSGSFSAY